MVVSEQILSLLPSLLDCKPASRRASPETNSGHEGGLSVRLPAMLGRDDDRERDVAILSFCSSSYFFEADSRLVALSLFSSCSSISSESSASELSSASSYPSSKLGIRSSSSSMLSLSCSPNALFSCPPALVLLAAVIAGFLAWFSHSLI